MSEKTACMPLEYDDFRHVVHHYREPKFRLELAVPEVKLVILQLHFFLGGASLHVKKVAERAYWVLLQALGLLDLFEDRAP